MYHSRLHATNGVVSLALDAVSGGWLLTGKALYFFTLLQTGSGSVILYPNY